MLLYFKIFQYFKLRFNKTLRVLFRASHSTRFASEYGKTFASLTNKEIYVAFARQSIRQWSSVMRTLVRFAYICEIIFSSAWTESSHALYVRMQTGCEAQACICLLCEPNAKREESPNNLRLSSFARLTSFVNKLYLSFFHRRWNILIVSEAN